MGYEVRSDCSWWGSEYRLSKLSAKWQLTWWQTNSNRINTRQNLKIILGNWGNHMGGNVLF